MKFLRQYISAILLAAVSLLVAPHDFLHELLEHHETQDELCTEGCGLHVGEAHQHCNCPQLSSPPLYHPVNKFSICVAEAINIQSPVVKSEYHFNFSSCLFLRGPPSVS